MSVTAQQVIDRLNLRFSNATGGKWSDAELLGAINAAIDDAWPHIRAVAQDTSQTIAALTYEYTPSATPEVECGFAQAYAARDGFSDVLLRGVTQEQSATAFVVHLPEEVTSAYTGWTLRLVYTKRIPRVTATTDTIELPLPYLEKAAAVFLLTNKMVDDAKNSVDQYEKLVVKFERDTAQSLIQHQRGLIAHLIGPAQGQGSANRQRLTSGYFA